MTVAKFKTITIEAATERIIDYRGKTPPKTTNGVRLITAKVVKGGQIRDEPAEYIAADFFDEWMRRGLPQRNDVLVTTEAPLGEVAILRDDARIALAQRIILLRAKAGVMDPHFLFYALQSDFGQGELKARATGTTVAGIKQSELRQVRIPQFSLLTQVRIGEILSAYDELIENNQRRIQILEAMARGIYLEWLVQFRFPGHKAHPRVSTDVRDIPDGWQVRKLHELAESVRRNVPKGALREPQAYVGLEHIPRRSLALDSWETITTLGSNKLAFKKGDVLFGKIRPYFHKVCVAPFDGVCSADTIVIRPRSPEHAAIVIACVSSDAFVARASATANGAKMPRANWEVLENYAVVIPKAKISEQFSGLFLNAVSEQNVLMSQIQSLRRSRDLLLPRLLTGDLEVKAN